MNPRVQRSFKKPFIFTAILFAVIVTVINIVSMRFHLTGTTPHAKDFTPNTPLVTFNFNRPLDANATSTPVADQNIILSSKVDGKNIQVKLNFPTNANKTYTITIANVQAADGTKLSNIKFTFKPKDVPYEQQSKQQQQALINAQDQYQDIHDDPLLLHLPYSTLSYTAEGAIAKVNGKDTVQVTVNIMLDASEVSDGGQDQAIAKHKQEFVNYVKSLGIDPSKYTISYTVTQPSLQ
jgi:hypothetical protein